MKRFLRIVQVLFAGIFLTACNGMGEFPKLTPPPGFFSVDSLAHGRPLGYPSLSYSGRYMAVATGKDETPQAGQLSDLYVIDLDRNEVIYEVEKRSWDSIEISPDGEYLIAGVQYPGDLAPYGRAHLFEISNKEALDEIGVIRPTWAPNGQFLAYVSYTANTTEPTRQVQLQLIDLDTRDVTNVLSKDTEWGWIRDVVWSEDSSKLAFVMQLERGSTGNNYGDLYVLDLETKELLQISDGWTISTPQFSASGNQLIFAGSPLPDEMSTEYHLYVVSLDGQCHRIESPVPRLQSVEISSNGERIALDTYYGVLIAESKSNIGENFWEFGDTCRQLIK